MALPGDLRRALREELDIHSAFTWEKFLREGLDAHFNARTVALDETERAARPSEYWRQDNYAYPFDGRLVAPKDLRAVSIYSKDAFTYPRLTVWCTLPRFTLVEGESLAELWLGLEDGSAGNIVALHLRKDSRLDNVLEAVVGGLRVLWQHNRVETLKPSNWDTARHTYSVALTRSLAIFAIDGRPIHFVVLCSGADPMKVKEDVRPYGVSVCPLMPRRLTTLMELYVVRDVETEDKVAPIAPYGFRVNEGAEVEPLALPLYLEDTDTKLAGHTIESGSATSHPFPTLGYARKSIYFMADQAGTLSIEVYTAAGNWREYDSVSVAANSLAAYNMVGEALLARVAFTPDTYPAKVLEAEVVLS